DTRHDQCSCLWSRAPLEHGLRGLLAAQSHPVCPDWIGLRSFCPFQVQARVGPYAQKEGKQMSILPVPGAQLSYEVSGSGPLLILIPGASGTGESFRPLAAHLISRYQMVIYDRRGFSQSKLDGPQDYAHRLAVDADDVRRLIEHVTDQPAMV